MTAKGSNFDNLAPHAHMDDLEAAANDTCTAEDAFDLFRFGVGGDIKILGRQAQAQIRKPPQR